MDDLDLGATIKGFSPGQKVFNRYTLSKILGRGGMGVVWLARDEELGRDTALKFLPEIIAADRDAIEDLKREVRRAIDLAHPHIVKIHDFVTDGRLAAVSMEYVKGQTLTALRHDEPGRLLPLAKLSPWVAQLGTALAYAHHDAQVVHRDLKPANLMIDDRGRLKVLDFGIAASVSDSVSRVSQQAGSSGTPVYMSPQQMMGERPAVTDDIYALGATLYDLLAGKPPFASGNIMLQVLNKPAPSLAEKRAELGLTGEPIPPEWEATIMACLAKEPKDRPQSAKEVLERLRIGEGGLRSAPARSWKVTTDAADKTDEVGPDRPPSPRLGRTGRAEQESDSAVRNPKSAIFIIGGIVLLGGLGWWFGIHAPEQRRLEAERLRVEQARIESERQRTAAEAARLAAARGGIAIRTNPTGAEVRVGAVALDKSPLTLKDQRLGKYPVRVRLEGYEEWAGEVEVKENDFVDLDVSLVRSTGRVVLTGTTGAVVTSGNTRLGTLPLTLDRVPTGPVRYSVALQGHKSAELTGEVTRNTELRLSTTLEKQLYPQPGQPFENTLGQKFVPVPGTNVLFSIWETREQDYDAFARVTGRSWNNANAGPTHPAVNVSWDDAQAFCQWLTQEARRAGRLRPDQSYRLPTDAEWSVAVGLPNEPGSTPADKDMKIKNHYPWGTQWPPPRGVGNYSQTQELDSFEFTSPVGSFAANGYGLNDMGGNVWEWVQDEYRPGSGTRVLRGSSFNGNGSVGLLSSSRYINVPGIRYDDHGFRVVVAFGSSAR